MDAKPFGVLMLHGFPSNAGYFQALDSTLKEMGLITSAVKFKGLNEGNPQALEGVTWRDWLADAESALMELKAECDRVAVIGFSMGGSLAVMLAAAHSAGIPKIGHYVDSLVLVSANVQMLSPFAPGRPFNFLEPLMARFFKKWDFPPDETDFYRKNYVWAPAGAVVSVLDLSREARRRLPEIRLPVLLLQGRKDTAVAPENMEIIFNGISTPPGSKQILWFEQNGHDMLYDREKEAVIGAISGYLRERIGQAASEPAAV